MRSVFLSSIRIFYVDVDPYNMVFQGDMLSSNRGPSGGGNSEVRCHRALIVCGNPITCVFLSSIRIF